MIDVAEKCIVSTGSPATSEMSSSGSPEKETEASRPRYEPFSGDTSRRRRPTRRPGQWPLDEPRNLSTS